MSYPIKGDILPFWDPNIIVRFAGDNSENRRIVYYIPKIKETGKWEVTQYARYLMENQLGRYLTNQEFIDHIDRDKRNDSFPNLRIVPKSVCSREDLSFVESVTITCVLCAKQAQKKPNQLNHNAKKGKAGPFCGKSCAGRYSAEVQNGKREPLPAQPFIPIENRIYSKIDKDTGNLKINTNVDLYGIQGAKVAITCMICQTKSIKSYAWLSKNAELEKAGPFCGKSCASKYTRGVQLGTITPLPPQRKIDPSEIIKV